MFKQNEAKRTHAEPTTKWFDRAPQLMSYPSKQPNYKRGKSSMIATDNMHQGYIFRVCSVVLLVVQRYRFCWCCSFRLLALLNIPSWGWGGRRGSMCLLFFVAAVALCVPVRGPGANLNTVKTIVTLHWIQTYLLYIYISNSSEKSKDSNEPINTLHFLFWLAAKHNAPVDSLFHCPAAHAAAGQGDAWCLQGMAI